MDTLAKIKNTITDNGLISAGDVVIVALSGGADSVCTFLSLFELSKELDFTLKACHLHHGLRGAEADRDMEFARELCARYGVEFYERRADMRAYARENGLSEEDAGRRLRREFFADIIAKNVSVKIATGHNRGDRAETVLQRAVRGTGIEGVCSIRYKSGYIIRPVLDISRIDIEAFVRSRGERFVTDSTNLESKYNRNKIRNDILPELREINPRVEDALIRLSDSACQATDYISSQVEYHFERCVAYNEDCYIINASYVQKIHSYLRAMLFRDVIIKFKGELSVTSYDIDRIEQLLFSETGAVAELSGNIRAERSYGDIRLFKENENVEQTVEKFVNLGDYDIPERGIKLCISEIDCLEKSKGSYIVSGLEFPILLRSRRDGDRYRPFGMSGTKKLKDVFIDKKIPRADRDKYLILESGGKIACILDIGISEDFKYKAGVPTYKIEWRKYDD